MPWKTGSNGESLFSLLSPSINRHFSFAAVGLAPLFARVNTVGHIAGISSVLSLLLITEALSQLIECLPMFPRTAIRNEETDFRWFLDCSCISPVGFKGSKYLVFKTSKSCCVWWHILSHFKISPWHGSWTCLMFSVSLTTVLNDCHKWKPVIFFTPAFFS